MTRSANHSSSNPVAAPAAIDFAAFRQTPLTPPARRRPPKPVPLITDEERLQLIRNAREQVDHAKDVIGCMARQAHDMKRAIGGEASIMGAHYFVALQAMADQGARHLKESRARLNTLETIVMYGSYGAPGKP